MQTQRQLIQQRCPQAIRIRWRPTIHFVQDRLEDSLVSQNHSWIQTVGLRTEAAPEKSETALSVACYQ